MGKGKIIVLNGVSSSGKSTLAKALVKALPGFFHLSIDDFDLVIEKMEDRANEHLIPVPTEYFYHRTVAMFSDKGVNLILDQIFHDQFTIDSFQKTLAGYPVMHVGVHCPPEELERRERERGDRRIGMAKEQLQFVHQQNESYEVEVNTFQETTESCVKRIVEKAEITFQV